MFIANIRLKSAVQRILCEIREYLDFAEMHPVREMQKIAIRETVEYVQARMQGATGVYTTRQVFGIAFRNVEGTGKYLEFGVFRGGTIRYIAKQHPGTIIHGFDSFEGLPERWAAFSLEKGAFSLSGKVPKVPRNVQLHKGWFDLTLPQWLDEYKGHVSFLHIDCDLYSSTKTIFDGLCSRIVPGTVIVFDEYFGYPHWKAHEFKAFQEFVVTHKVTYDYLAYAKWQVALKIRNIQNR